MSEYMPNSTNSDQPERGGLRQLGEGIYEIVGPGKPLEPGTELSEGAPSSASQEAANRNTEQYWGTLLELRDELMESAQNGDEEAKRELPVVQQEIYKIYGGNATRWAERENPGSPQSQ